MMQSATLFLLASSMGVLFGWQPMPDGSPRYEYVVQLDPDLLAALEAGESIPISTDIPEDLQPIGRIRIVVGREPLPRTRLTTALKPVPLKKSREGLVETQHRVAPVEPATSGRYNNAPAQTILPPNDAAPSSILPPQDTQGLAGSLQGATQSLGNQLRNVGESVRTDAQQMFGRTGLGSVGNDVSSGVAGQIGKAAEQMQQGFQQGTEPFRQAAQQAGQQLRNAAENLGQQARETVDQFGRPLRERSILDARGNNPRENDPRESNPQTILPPGSTPPQQQFTGNPSRGQQFDQPVSSRRDPREASPWRNSEAPGSNPPPAFSNTPPARTTTTHPEAFNTPWPSQGQDPYRNQATLPRQQSATPQILPNKAPRDRFDLANHPTANQQAELDDTSRRNPPNAKWANTPNFPANNSSTSHNSNISPPSASNDNHSHASSAPEIRRNMLDNPADAALLTAGGQPTLPASGPTFSQPSERQPSERPTRARDFGWDNASRRASDSSPSRNEDPTRTVFPLLLSWVLLSGSGAGNLYLLWSFWDVRNKYRGLVHNARGSSGRYS